MPTPSTPPYSVYEHVNNRWWPNQPHGSNVCKDVRITFTTEPNRTYYIECGSLYQPKPWETRPGVTIIQWFQCSEPITGTGSPHAWHGGGAYSHSYYRVRQQ